MYMKGTTRVCKACLLKKQAMALPRKVKEEFPDRRYFGSQNETVSVTTVTQKSVKTVTPVFQSKQTKGNSGFVK